MERHSSYVTQNPFPMQRSTIRQKDTAREGTCHYCLLHLKTIKNSFNGALNVQALYSSTASPAPHLDLCVNLTQTMTPDTTTREGITLVAAVYVSPSHFSINPQMAS